MPLGSDPTPIVIENFAGLATVPDAKIRPGGMRPNQARLLENIEPDNGNLRVRLGHKRLKVARVDSTRPILGFWRAYKGTDGSRKQIVHTRNKLWTLSGSAVASITGSLTLTSGHAHTGFSYQDIFYGSNGVNPWWKWSFSGKATAVATPGENYEIVFAFEEKIVHARGASNKDKVAWSDEGLPATYQSLHFFFYPPDRSDELTLAYPLAGEIILGTPQKIGKTVGGLPPRAVVDIELGKGCASYHSAAVVHGWLYYVGIHGDVYRTDGNVVQEVSSDLALSDVNTGTKRMLRGVGEDDRYYRLSYPSRATGATFPDRIITYDSLFDQWYGPHKVMRASAWFEFRTPGDDGHVAGGTPSGYAAVFYSGSSDAGARITGVYEGPVFPGPDPSYRAAIDEFEIQGKAIASGTATVGIYYDRGATVSSIGTVSLKTTGPVEGDRDSTSVSRAWVFDPKKVKFAQTPRLWQPRVSIAQKSGRAEVSLVRFLVKQLKYR